MNSKTNLHLTFITGILILSVAACLSAAGLKTCEIFIFNSKQVKIKAVIEIAESRNDQVRGLMFRKELGENSGMLFVYNYDSNLNFWMKNTFIPLTVAYIDKNGIIKDMYDMKPLDTSVTYTSKYPVRYALEMNMGWFQKNNITIGSKVYLDGCISK
ncbi:MAG: DUF192 domain-containing protein [Spirochaetes bacterium]|nr:DUF192 domain-containing protein [Spirochaetota bacterium]